MLKRIQTIKRHFSVSILLLLPTFIISACTVGPNYKRPDVTVPNKFKEAKNKRVMAAKSKSKDWKIAEPNDDFDRGEWWKIFHDKKLNALEAELNISNQTIATAEANYWQAYDLVDEARASFYPAISSSASLTRQKGFGSTSINSSPNSTSTSSSGTSSTGISATSSSRITVSHTINFNAAWAPDIWGLVRRTVEGKATGAQASAALLANTRLSAQGSLATFYFQLRALDTDQKLLDANVRDYKKILKLTKNQYKAGVASTADVLQAKSTLEAAQALAINNGVNRATFEHAIAVLIGKAASDFSIAYHPLTTTPPPIPVALPSTLLERRPDVAQAERLMAQANAQIGVAIAAYYPTLNLTGNGSFVGSNYRRWISMPQLGWAYGPQLSELLYDGGLRSATVKAARAGYDSTVASYRQIVLAAFQNVEDNLSTLRILTTEATVQNAAAVTAKKALKFVINQYRAGTVPFSSVLTAEVAAFTAEKNAADITGLRMNAAVGLVMALGGGWDAHSIDHAADSGR